MQVHLTGRGDLKQPHHQDGIGFQNSRVEEVQPSGLDPKSGFEQRVVFNMHRRGHVAPFGRRRIFELVSLQLGANQTRQRPDINRTQEVIAHEDFDRELVFGVDIAHACGHLGLDVKGQAIILGLQNRVQMKARGPVEIGRRQIAFYICYPEQVFANPTLEGVRAIKNLR